MKDNPVIDLTNKDTAHHGPETKFQTECAQVTKKVLLHAGFPQMFFHPPNEGIHKPQYRAKQKAMGVKSGVSDCIIMVPRKGFHGLVIELKVLDGKKKIGKLSDSQKTWVFDCAAMGYATYIVSDLETYKSVLAEYLYE